MSTNQSCKTENKVRGRPRKKSKKSENAGRKKVNVKEASKATVYRRALELLGSSSYDSRTIQMAASIIKKRGVLVERVCDNESEKENLSTVSKHSNESALAFYLEYNYNKRSYEALVHDSRLRGCPVYPSYKNVYSSMDKCQPKKLFASEVEVAVPLQELLKKSAERLCDSVALHWRKSDLDKLNLIVTLGFDSSSGHTNPHQKYQNNENSSEQASQSLLVSSVVIIMLRSLFSKDYSWTNPTPQSVRFCRPIRIALEKEDATAITKEYNRLTEEISALNFYSFKLANGRKAKISYTVSHTLFDGKCVNTIVGNNASNKCPMCLRTAHNFSNLSDTFEANEMSLELGLGLLNAEIKAMEHLLHISYRALLKTWDVRKDLKEQMSIRKIHVQKRIYDRIGVRVDQVLQGHGTANTGNIARKCFQNPMIFADSLEIDEELVSRISVILLAFKCKNFLNLDKLEKYCWQTYCLYYEKFPWARMSPTVHKLLKHGCDIAKKFSIPVAYYSEDANESWHKLYRKNMISHARQNSRANRLLDVFNRAMCLSDPSISLILIKTRLQSIKDKEITSDVQQFMDESLIQDESDNDTDNSM